MRPSRIAVAAASAMASSMVLPALAQVPAEWPGAAHAVLAELERGTPLADRAVQGEARQGWTLARKWRLHDSRSAQVTLAEYLTMVSLCRWSGCAGDMVAGRTIATRSAEVRAEKARYGGTYALVDASFAWLAGLAGPGTEPARKNAGLWARDRDAAAADAAVSSIYALGWLLAREQPDPARQASMMSAFGLFVNGKAWIGERCLDITRVAAVLDAPPRVERCN